jgi:MurNAc alpha-1-phosphate uridylyltransferase
VRWSREGTALGTAGGVATALPLLTAPAFALVSADLYTTYDYARLKAPLAALTHEPQGATEAHLVLVKNPRYPRDFSLYQQRVVKAGQDAGTYGNIGVFRRRFFEMLAPGQPAELGPLLHAAVARGALSGEWLEGRWANVGTAADLEQLQSSGTDPNLGTDPHGAPSPGEPT